MSGCSWKKVPWIAGHEVLMKVDDNILLIVGNPQWIVDQPFKPHPIH
jgi:hypothetical protein